MIKYIIVDDEPIAHDIIKRYCDALPNLTFVRHCYDAIEAMECLRNNKVDLIFLDLNMPKLKGFDFLKTLQNPPKIIVTTAHKEHALEGYELDIVDFLLKPFGFERFLKAVNKALGPFPKQSVQVAEKGTAQTETLFVYTDKKHIQIKIEDILIIEASGNYTKIILMDTTLITREKFSDFLQGLPVSDFVQVHKSFAVAKKQIDIIEGNRISIKTHTVPIGKMFKLNLINLLG